MRNWDYRYCWLRDSVLALEALLDAGYTEEALAFRDFLLRVGTGDPAAIQIMYGVGGERRLSEFELPHLPGYEGSRPVRIGNAASEQFQLDVYGEVAAVMFIGAERLGRIEARLWPRWRAIVDYVETIWRRPDDGIWEARGPQRHYTYSKVMAWVVFDRAVRIAEQFGMEAPLERWAAVRDEIHAEVCEQGYDRERRTFTQYYGSKELDASVLNIPIVGLPARRRRARHRHDRRGLARAGPRRLRLPLLDGRDRRRPARRRGPVPGLLVLAGERARAQRPRRGGARAVRAARRALQRPRPARGGVRRGARAPGRQLPPGVQPPHADPRRTRDRHRRGARGRGGRVSVDPPDHASATARRRFLAPLALAQFICSFAGSNMNVMINDITEDLDTTVAGVQATITLFLLVMAVLMIPCSKLTDRWGRKRCFTAGLILYGIGALLSAVAPNLAVLMIGNSVLEGIGTALLIPPVYILTTLHFHDLASRARAFGVISGMGGIGAAAGPLIGGVITSAISWRAAFVFQALIIVAIVLLARRIADPLPADPSRPFDAVGAALSAVGMFFVVFGILQADSDPALMALLLAAGAAFLAWFFLHIRARERARP